MALATQRTGPRRLALVVLTALLISGALAASTLGSHRAFAVGCNGSSCNAEDPSAMGCDRDAQVLQDFEYDTDPFVLVKLDYSPACQAEWVRWVNIHPGRVQGGLWAELAEWTSQSGGSLIVVLDSVVGDSDGNVGLGGWTDMWTYASWGQACISNQPANPYALGTRWCTGRH